MLAAASAWDRLAGELHAAAGSFASVTTGWRATARGMVRRLAMTRPTRMWWLNLATGQAAQATGQARLTASVRATLARPPSPAVIAANRTRLASLVAALGQTPRRSLYIWQIWAQDVARCSAITPAASAHTAGAYSEGLQQQL